MSAARLNIEIEQGATWKHTLQLTSGDVTMNLSGYTARMQIRKNYASESTLANLTSSSGITISQGTLSLLLSATSTTDLPSGAAVYDLEIESASGEVTRVIFGDVYISRQVTR